MLAGSDPRKDSTLPDFLSVDDAARRLNHTRTWLYRRLDQIPTVKIGGRRLVPAKLFDQFVDDLAAGRIVLR